MKLKTVYICENCQYESSKWAGNCSQCGAWNSFQEDVVDVSKNSNVSKNPRTLGRINVGDSVRKSIDKDSKVFDLSEISKKDFQTKKIKTNISEFDRVIGEGFVSGSLTLLSGEPGIGKSTLTLQIANNLAVNSEVLIVSGEESVTQVGDRALRLLKTSNHLKENQNLKISNEFVLEKIIEIVKKIKPTFLIVDSIQVIASEALPSASGSISQVKYCTEILMELAKSSGISIILIGHVTKEGNLAGPRVLEHLVDTVLILEGDRFQQFRLLRSVKNRFGSCNEVGVFEMDQNGLVEVKNPSAQFLEGRKKDPIGSAITVAIEGTRPFLVEVQALTTTSHFGYPKRTANGFDLNRLQILIAVLEKYGGLRLQDQDVFVNIVGGIKLKEPAADLAVCLAIASSFYQKSLPESGAIFGEVGLTGELRKVGNLEKRRKESNKLGFEVLLSGKEKEISEVLQKILR